MPLVSRWAEAYPGPGRVDVRSTGSAGAVRLLEVGKVDFGVSDVTMTAAELERTPSEIVTVPLARGTLAVATNLPGASDPLRLDDTTLASIFLGEIDSWDDARISADNPGRHLPHLAIVPVHRTDGSGTTAVFTDYLASRSPLFADKVGRGPSARFPSGVGAKGTEGITFVLKSTPGAVGVVELGIARANHLVLAEIRGKSGAFVPPRAGLDSGYPLVTTVYALVPKTKNARTPAVLGFLRYVLGPGQERASSLDFTPLSTNERETATALLDTSFGGPP
jgi:phosphate transport system substrate-binding protein